MATRIQKVNPRSTFRVSPTAQPRVAPPLCTALFRLRRAFHLFANSHAKPLADQRQKIPFGRMMWHTTHWNVLHPDASRVSSAQYQAPRCSNGIVKEHLVKIAHAIKQQGIRIPGLEFKILRHHRRDVSVSTCSCIPQGSINATLPVRC